MFCSGCGQALAPGQSNCPQCGRPVVVAIPPVPGLQFQLSNYAGKVRALSIVWFLYGSLSVVFGFIGLAFARAMLAGHMWWLHGPMAPGAPTWLGPAVVHLAWMFLVVRAGLALVAGWGLLQHAPWGRVVAIVAAVLNIFKFPFGTALAIWTLAMLLGYRNSTLYEQLPES